MFTRIDHIALHVNNIEKSTKFYTENFGFQDYFYNIVANGLKIRYLKLGDTILELSGHSDGEITGFHFCLQTMDFLNSINKLIENNVSFNLPQQLSLKYSLASP